MVRFRVGKSYRFKRMKVAAIIFSRMASSRLPGKALRHIAGEPLIKRVINRVSKVKKVSTVVVATSDSKNDDRLVEYIQSLNIETGEYNLETQISKNVQYYIDLSNKDGEENVSADLEEIIRTNNYGMLGRIEAKDSEYIVANVNKESQSLVIEVPTELGNEDYISVDDIAEDRDGFVVFPL